MRGIQRWPVNSPYKWSVTRKCFHLMTSSWHKHDAMAWKRLLHCNPLQEGPIMRGFGVFLFVCRTNCCWNSRVVGDFKGYDIHVTSLQWPKISVRLSPYLGPPSACYTLICISEQTSTTEIPLFHLISCEMSSVAYTPNINASDRSILVYFIQGQVLHSVQTR